MKTTVALLLGVVCLAQAMHMPTQKAENQQLIQQKNTYELLWHVDQPSICHPDMSQTAKMFDIMDHMDSYHDKAAVTEYVKLMKTRGLLPRGAAFSIMNPKHQKETVLLYRVLHSAKDDDIFQKTATWARFNVNELMFIYVMSVMTLRCPESEKLPFPAFQEIVPQFFFNEDVLHKAVQISMGKNMTAQKNTVDGIELYVFPAEYDCWNTINDKSPEQKMNYFTEDVGMNANYFIMFNEFPFWMNSKEYKLPTNIRGELYLFQHKQLLNRYSMERTTNGLGEVDYINLNQPITSGYYPMMHHYNGMPFPQRPANSKIPKEAFKDVQGLHDIKDRISNAIDKGYVITEKGEHINIYDEQGLNVLGNIIQGNADSVNPIYYGQMDKLYKKIVSKISSLPTKDGNKVPTALDMIATNMRDPAFYQIYKTILLHLTKYKTNLPTYKTKDLLFPGVEIESLTIDKLTTYFEQYDSLINNVIPIRNKIDAESMQIKVQQQRLKHKPYNYQLTVNSEKDVQATVRIFLGLTKDVNGKELDLSQNCAEYVQLDQWTVDLKAGTNKIERSCNDNVFGIQDTPSTDVTYKQLLKAINDGENYNYTPRVGGFPERMMLPKGKKEGLACKFFVSVTPCDKAVEIPIQIYGPNALDGKPLGYPLDRPITDTDKFMVPNFKLKDAVIYHKTAEELNATWET